MPACIFCAIRQANVHSPLPIPKRRQSPFHSMISRRSVEISAASVSPRFPCAVPARHRAALVVIQHLGKVLFPRVEIGRRDATEIPVRAWQRQLVLLETRFQQRFSAFSGLFDVECTKTHNAAIEMPPTRCMGLHTSESGPWYVFQKSATCSLICNSVSLDGAHLSAQCLPGCSVSQFGRAPR